MDIDLQRGEFFSTRIKNMRRIIICCLLIIVILLSVAFSGCQMNSMIQPTATQRINMQNSDTFGNGESVHVMLPLYFPDTNEDRILAETREATLAEGQTAAQRAILEMIQGPTLQTLHPVLPKQVELRSLEISRNVANIDFSSAFLNLSATDQIAARVALSCSLYDIAHVEYINIFVEGELLGYLGRAIGLIRYRTYAGNLTQLMERMDAYEKTGEQEYTIVLYFADMQNQYFLPEIRTIQTGEDHLIQTIVEELVKPPTESALLQSLLSSDTVLLDDPVITSTKTGNKIVELNLSKRAAYGALGKNTSLLYYGALVYTIESVIPNVQNVIIKNNGEIIKDISSSETFKDGLMNRDMFKEYLGDVIKLYFPNQSRTKLLPIYRSVQQTKAKDVSDCLIEMMRGPLEYETENIWPVFPAGVTEKDLIRIIIDENIAYVDLSANFYEKCKILIPQNEYLLAYAIVNAITETTGIKRVQFLCDGSYRETLAGNISIQTPLMNNPGLIASS